MEAGIEICSLGRPFALGMLYDRRTDKIIPTYSLWKKETLEKKLNVDKYQQCKAEIVVDDSFEKKSTNLGVDTDLKLSIMANLVKASGHFKYLHDRKTSSRQARVTLQCRLMTQHKSLSMEHLREIEYPEVLDDCDATHVVTAITYGLEAYFVFNQSCSSVEAMNKVTAGMKASVEVAVKPICNPDGGITVNSKPGNSDTKQDNVTCQYYGDRVLPRLPLTYEDAAKTCQELAKLEKDGVPKLVYLTPVYKLKKDHLENGLKVHTISEFLAIKVEGILESLHEAEIECQNLKSSEACATFRLVKDQISKAEELLKLFTAQFTSKLSKLVPKARETGKEEKLEQLLESISLSPFSRTRLQKYVDTKGTELRVLERHRQNFKKSEHIHEAFASESGKLQELIHNRQYQKVFAFVFGVTAPIHPCISAMETFLNTGCCTSTCKTSQLEWFDDQDIVNTFLAQVEKYVVFADDNKANEKFAFTVTEACTSIQASAPTIKCFLNGRPIDFEPFPQPEKIMVVEQDRLVAIFWNLPSPYYVEKFHVHYKCSNDSDSKWETMTMGGNSKKVVLETLKRETSYDFRVQGESIEYGLTPMSTTTVYYVTN